MDRHGIICRGERKHRIIISLLAAVLFLGLCPNVFALTATVADCTKCHCDKPLTGDLHHSIFTYKPLADGTTTMYYNLTEPIGPHYYKERWVNQCYMCHSVTLDPLTNQYRLTVNEETCYTCHRAVDPFYGTSSVWMNIGHHLNATDCSVCHKEVRVKGVTDIVFTENCAASPTGGGGGGKK